LRSSWIISACGHAAVLLVGLITFASSKSSMDSAEFMPVQIVTPDNVSRPAAGVSNASKPVDNAKPLAEKVADVKPVDELAPKVSNKPEIRTDSAAPPAKPEPKPEQKPVEKVEKPKDQKPKDPKPADQIAQELKKQETKKPPKKQPEFKPDQIAEELKKEEAKQERPSPKFNADQVAALLDKREPQRQLAAADTLNNAAALGTPNGQAAQLSMSEMDALRRRLSECWNPPPGIDMNSNVYVVLRVQFKADGSLLSEPAVVEDAAASLGPALAESAKRALLACQPFTMLKPEHYAAWKDVMIGFNPHELLGQ
jgi:outer membrane biosynthesis protein TonB